MANCCDFDLYVLGPTQATAELARRMRDYRVYEFTVSEDWRKGDLSASHIFGDCAWSVNSSMYVDAPYADDPHGLTKTIADLGLTAEIWSSEVGFEFQEHYLISPDGLEVSEEFDYREVHFDKDEMSFEEWKQENGIPADVAPDDLEDGEWYIEYGKEPSVSTAVLPDPAGWSLGVGQVAHFGGRGPVEEQVEALEVWAGAPMRMPCKINDRDDGTSSVAFFDTWTDGTEEGFTLTLPTQELVDWASSPLSDGSERSSIADEILAAYDHRVFDRNIEVSEYFCLWQETRRHWWLAEDDWNEKHGIVRVQGPVVKP